MGSLIDGTFKPSPRHNGRIKFGTEASGGFRNCVVSNCTFRNCYGLALEEVDGGVLEDIAISNITMIDVPNCAIYLTTGVRNRTPGLTTKSTMRNITISNVIADGAGKLCAIEVMGTPEVPIEGVRMDNIRLIGSGGGTAADAALKPKELGMIYPEPGRLGTMPAYGIFARHVKGLELSNVDLSYKGDDARPAVVMSDADGVRVDNVKAQVGEGVTGAIVGADVKGLVVRDSPVFEGVGK